MAKKIYVANLPPSTTEDEVRELFGEFGAVEWVHLVTATDTGRSRGCGYVAMTSGGEGLALVLLGDLLLLLVGVEDGALVLGTPVHKLPSRVRGVDLAPE